MIKAPDVNFLAIAPMMSLMIGAFVLLLLASFIRGRDRGLGTVVGLVALLASAGFAINLWSEPATTTMAGALQVDQLTQVVTVLIAGCGILTLLVSFGWNRMRENGAEFVALLLLIAAGMDLIAASNSFVTLFVALELFSLSLYVLCAFDGKSKASLESGFKYLVLGTIGSMVLVYGAAFLYGATGSFGFEAINTALSKAGSGEALVILGTVLVLIGLAFKIGVMPFHMWVADVYEGAPTSVTGFMSAATKIAAFVALARVLLDALPAMRDTWAPALIIIAVVTMLLGNISALVQTNLKRMLAYASVGAAGFGLIAIIVGGAAGTRGLIFYLAAYAPMAIGAFAVISLHERDHKGIATLDSIRGWGFNRPVAAVSMVVFLLGFAGFPLTVGFIGKFVVLGSAVEGNYTWLGVVAVIASVISLGYLLRIILAMFDRGAKSGVMMAAAPGMGSLNLAIVLCLALVLVGGILPGLGLDWAADAAKSLAAGR